MTNAYLKENPEQARADMRWTYSVPAADIAAGLQSGKATYLGTAVPLQVAGVQLVPQGAAVRAPTAADAEAKLQAAREALAGEAAQHMVMLAEQPGSWGIAVDTHTLLHAYVLGGTGVTLQAADLRCYPQQLLSSGQLELRLDDATWAALRAAHPAAMAQHDVLKAIYDGNAYLTSPYTYAVAHDYYVRQLLANHSKGTEAVRLPAVRYSSHGEGRQGYDLVWGQEVARAAGTVLRTRPDVVVGRYVACLPATADDIAAAEAAGKPTDDSMAQYIATKTLAEHYSYPAVQDIAKVAYQSAFTTAEREAVVAALQAKIGAERTAELLAGSLDD